MGNHSEKQSLRLGDRNNADYEAWVSVRWGNDTSEDGDVNLRYCSANADFDGRSVGVRNDEVFCRDSGDFSAFSARKRWYERAGNRTKIRIISTETTVPNWLADLQGKLKT